MDLDRIFAVEEMETLAEGVMEPPAFAYYAGGAGLEQTVAENSAAYRRYRFKPRVLQGHTRAELSTTVLGAEVASPVALAPTALQKLAHPDGEAASARAAAKAGALFCAATESSCTLEEIAEASSGLKWFQCYVNQNRDVTEGILLRAESAGYRAIVLTVDLPVPGYREREYKHPYVVPAHAGPGNYEADHSKPIIDRVTAQYNQGLTWRDLDWIRGVTDLPLVLKGIMTPEDAAIALDHGADGLVVSNHGGRQLDQVSATIDALAPIVEQVGSRAEVYVDGGIRRGTDVLIALSLGARAVFVGRPYLWGLALGGEAGVSRVLSILSAQLANAMLQLGAGKIKDINRDYLLR